MLVAGIGAAAAIVALAVLVVGRLGLVSVTAAATVAVAIAVVVGAVCFFQFGSGPRELWRDRLLVIAPVFLVAAPGIVGAVRSGRRAHRRDSLRRSWIRCGRHPGRGRRIAPPLTGRRDPSPILRRREPDLRLLDAPRAEVPRSRPAGAARHLALVPSGRQDRRPRPERRGQVDAAAHHGRRRRDFQARPGPRRARRRLPPPGAASSIRRRTCAATSRTASPRSAPCSSASRRSTRASPSRCPTTR